MQRVSRTVIHDTPRLDPTNPQSLHIGPGTMGTQFYATRWPSSLRGQKGTTDIHELCQWFLAELK